MVVKVPDAIAPHVVAATMLKGLTVAYLVNRSYKVKPGDVVLFHAAAGGVGLLAGQWLKSLGAKVIVTAGGEEKCTLAAANGYDHVIDYRAQDFAAEIDRLTDGVGVDVVYDTVGNDTMAKSLLATRRHGTVVNFGQSSSPYTDFQIKDLSVGSLYLTRATLFHFTAERAWLEAASADMFERIISGGLSVVINQNVALNDVANAHRALFGRQTTGCTVLTV